MSAFLKLFLRNHCYHLLQLCIAQALLRNVYVSCVSTMFCCASIFFNALMALKLWSYFWSRNKGCKWYVSTLIELYQFFLHIFKILNISLLFYSEPGHQSLLLLYINVILDSSQNISFHLLPSMTHHKEDCILYKLL